MKIEFKNGSTIETVNDYDDSDTTRSKPYFYMDEIEKILMDNHDIIEETLKDMKGTK
jgi:hypothetical protein